MATDRDRVCGNCLHWTADEEDPTSGYCQRYPPTVLYDTESGAFCLFPVTTLQDWCGEHKASQ
jgi:hypothetical protein